MTFLFDKIDINRRLWPARIGVFASLLLILFGSGCVHKGELDLEQAAELYIQCRIITEQCMDDTLRLQREKAEAFSRAGITTARLADFWKQYQSHPERWVEVQQKIVQKLKEREQQTLKAGHSAPPMTPKSLARNRGPR